MVPNLDSGIDEAEWCDLVKILSLTSTDVIPEYETLIPFIPFLCQWISRHHELRDEGEEMFGAMSVFSKDRWKGPAPKEILKALLENQKVLINFFKK